MSNSSLISQFCDLLPKGILFILSGPSGTGKSTITQALIQNNPELQRSVSVTTRQKRPGEKPAVDYIFVTEEEFDERLRKGDFLEHATVYQHRYGTPRGRVEETLKQGRLLLLDVDPCGVKQIQALGMPAVYIYLLPPDKDVLKNRLSGRKTDAETEIARRLGRFEDEIREIHLYDYLVFNSTVQQTVLEVQAIIESERHRIRHASKPSKP